MRGCGLWRNRELGAGRERRFRCSERDFAISLSPKRIAAGSVVFHVANRGPDRHEFIVVRVPAGGLPLRTDGMTISEEKLAPETAGGLEPAESGALRDLSVSFAPADTRSSATCRATSWRACTRCSW